MLRKTLSLFLCMKMAFAALSATGCNPYAPPPATPGYTAFTLVNQSNQVATGNVYVTVTGTLTTGPNAGQQAFILFDPSTGLGNPMVAAQALPTTYSYSVASLPAFMGNNYIYVPSGLSNASIYISIDYPLALGTTFALGNWQITPPSISDTTNSNYYHLYDSIAFSTNQNKLQLPPNLITSYGLSLSAVVAFNGGLNTLFLGLPPTVSRDNGSPPASSSVFGAYAAAVSSLTNAASKAQWGRLPVTFVPAGNGGATAYLRLFSTIFGMGLTSSPNTFDPTYLFNTVYGTGAANSDWFTSVFNTFTITDHLYMDLSAAGPLFTTYQLTAKGGTTLTFTPAATGPTVTVAPSSSTSQPFFTAAPIGPNSFNATQSDGMATIYPLICNYLSAGFVSGEFPNDFPLLTPLSYSVLQTDYVTPSPPGTFWGINSNLPMGGPWYDLYSAVLHRLAPYNSTNSYSNISTVPVDANLGFFETIQVSLSKTPAVAIVLGDMTGTVVPNFTDASLFNVSLAPTAGVTVTYQGTPPVTVVGPGNMSLGNVHLPIPLQITYTAGSYSIPTPSVYNTTVLLNTNYTVVFPQPPAPIAPGFAAGVWTIGIGIPP